MREKNGKCQVPWKSFHAIRTLQFLFCCCLLCFCLEMNETISFSKKKRLLVTSPSVHVHSGGVESLNCTSCTHLTIVWIFFHIFSHFLLCAAKKCARMWYCRIDLGSGNRFSSVSTKINSFSRDEFYLLWYSQAKTCVSSNCNEKIDILLSGDHVFFHPRETFILIQSVCNKIWSIT